MATLGYPGSPLPQQVVVNIPPPPIVPTHVPRGVNATLLKFGWSAVYVVNEEFFTHPNWEGYYTWSEALVLETSRTFLEVMK